MRPAATRPGVFRFVPAAHPDPETAEPSRDPSVHADVHVHVRHVLPSPGRGGRASTCLPGTGRVT